MVVMKIDLENDRTKDDAMVKHLVSLGVPYPEARLVVDLTNHACMEAMHAIERVAESAPDTMQSAVMVMALRSLAVNCAEAVVFLGKVANAHR
jgi:hypothetical protein